MLCSLPADTTAGSSHGHMLTAQDRSSAQQVLHTDSQPQGGGTPSNLANVHRLTIFVAYPQQNEMKPPGAGGEASDYEDFWHEYQNLHTEDVEEEEVLVKAEEDPEPEEEWLQAVGLGALAAPFRSGREVEESEVTPLVATLPRHHAAAVFRRVAYLNATVQRRRQKPARNKPDIRELFPSSAPETLVRIPTEPSSSPRGSPPSSPDGVPRFMHIFHGTDGESGTGQHAQGKSGRGGGKPPRGSAWMGGPGGDVANDTGIRMLGYHNFGTIYMPGYIPKIRPGREANISESSQEGDVTMDTEHHNNSSGNKRGFEAVLRETQHNDEEEVMTEMPLDPCGRTRLSDVSEEDAVRLRKLLLMELTALCDEEGIAVSRSKARRRQRKEAESGLFGVSLTRLLERDQHILPDCRVPIILQKLLSHLEHDCLDEEGLLRLAGHRQKTQQLRQTLEESLYTVPLKVDEALSLASPHDVSGVLKQFLRELPQPLLPSSLRDTFLQVPGLRSPKTQLRALNLLILLLPPAHRDTLGSLLIFLSHLSGHSAQNRMPLRNISMIMAPTLFLPSPSETRAQKDSLDSQVNVAAITCRLTEMMVANYDRLWTVPPEIIRHARAVKEEEGNRRNNRPMKRLLPRRVGRERDKDTHPVPAVPIPEVIHISAPQLGFSDHPIPIKSTSTATDVVWGLMTECLQKAESGSEPPNRRQLAQLAPEGSLSCLLNASDSDDALATHSLYEVGGNIGFRRLEPLAILAAVLEVNPNTNWELRCHHRGSSVLR